MYMPDDMFGSKLYLKFDTVRDIEDLFLGEQRQHVLVQVKVIQDGCPVGCDLLSHYFHGSLW